MWKCRVQGLQRALTGLAVATVVVVPALAQQGVDAFPYHPATHSHNDYRQPHPLMDALESGMASIEVDVFDVGVEVGDAAGGSRPVHRLYVAHEELEIEGKAAGRDHNKGTLRELYLDPLWALVQSRGDIYPGETLLLHVDMKTGTDTTWPVLEAMLRDYPGLFTSFDVATHEVVAGPVTIFTNAEPDADVLAGYGVIHATADGRFGNVFDASVWQSAAYLDHSWRMPVVSSNLRAYIDIERMFDVLVPKQEIVDAYAGAYAGLTVRNLTRGLDRDNWALANSLVADGSIAPSDYLIGRLGEASRLGTEHGHLMRFWAPPDARWFWELVAPLPNLVLLTDHPREASRFLDGR